MFNTKLSASLLILWIVSGAAIADAEKDIKEYLLALSDVKLECEDCAKAASAIIDMQKRLCGLDVNKRRLVEVKESEIYAFTLDTLKDTPEEKKETFMLAVQKGTNCLSDTKWANNATQLYKKSVKKTEKKSFSIKFWPDAS